MPGPLPTTMALQRGDIAQSQLCQQRYMTYGAC